jgi:ribose 5-phosphate isomerase B
MKIAIGNDHAGYELKLVLADWLKHQGIRATLCWMPEIAALARSHNDANIICLPGRFLDKETAIEILKVFLDTSFDGGRHQRRIDKVPM